MPLHQHDAALRSSRNEDDAHRAASSAPPRTDIKPAVRFAFVDGLRGLAALCVVVFHTWLYEPSPRALLVDAHRLFDEAFWRLKFGVNLLLVVSGFVIAFTLRNTWVTPRECLSFVSRRIVRLVPAYWFAIGFAVLTGILCRDWLQLEPPVEGEVSLPRVLAHLGFVQDVLGYGSLSAGLWTVCIEMQFYVVAVLGWGAAQYLVPRPDKDQPRPAVAALLLVFAPLAIGSLVGCYRQESTEIWVIYYLWRFVLGMSVWWTLDRTIPVSIFAIVVAIAAGQLVYEFGFDPLFDWNSGLPSANCVSLATALAIYFAGRTERLHLWLNWRWLQFVGRISYSLYLIHFPVIHVLTHLGWKWCGNTPTTIQAAGIMGSSIAASLLAGYWLHVLVEAPSFRWATKLKRP